MLEIDPLRLIDPHCYAEHGYPHEAWKRLRQESPLRFFEPPGWVIVDYKTDRIAFGHVPAAVEHYRAQVQTYADAWQGIVGQPLHERGLYFTHLNAYAKV